MLYALDSDIMKALNVKVKMTIIKTNPIESIPKFFHILPAE